MEVYVEGSRQKLTEVVHLKTFVITNENTRYYIPERSDHDNRKPSPKSCIHKCPTFLPYYYNEVNQ